MVRLAIMALLVGCAAPGPSCHDLAMTSPDVIAQDAAVQAALLDCRPGSREVYEIEKLPGDRLELRRVR